MTKYNSGIKITKAYYSETFVYMVMLYTDIHICQEI